jgi:hypothetical protein
VSVDRFQRRPFLPNHVVKRRMMASSEDRFQTLLSNFKKRLTQRELDDFQFTSLEDVRLEIARIQAEQAVRKEMINMPRIQSFLEAIDQFGKVIEVFLNTSEFVAFIWGPVKFVLQVRQATPSLTVQPLQFLR